MNENNLTNVTALNDESEAIVPAVSAMRYLQNVVWTY